MSRVIRFEIVAENPERCAEFYNKVFGWNITPIEGDKNYWMIETGDRADPGIDGAIIRRRSPDMSVINIIQVEILDMAIKIIETHGGKIVVPKFAVPGLGWSLYFKDPEGIIMGLLEPNPNAR